MKKRSLLTIFFVALFVLSCSVNLFAADKCDVSIQTGTSALTNGEQVKVEIYDASNTKVSSLYTAGSSTAYSTTKIQVEPGTYTYKGYSASSISFLGSGEFTVTGDDQVVTLKCVIFPKITNPANSYTNHVWNDDKTYEYTSGTDGNNFLLPCLSGDGHYEYAYSPDDTDQYWGSNGDLYVYPTVAPDTFIGLNLSDSGSFVVAQKKLITVKVPHGATIDFYHMVKFYRPEETMEKTLVGQEGSYDVYHVVLPNASVHYVLHMDGKVTQARMVSYAKYSTDDPLVISSADLTDDPTQIIRGGTQGYFDANLLMNINDANYMTLKTGEYYDIRCYRNWEAVSSITGNYYVDPDYHYTVAEGDSVTVDDNGRITAVKAGVSVIHVTYGALDWLDLSADPLVYSAIYPENTGVIVVNVDPDQSTAIKTNINRSSEYDTIYYTKSINGVAQENQYAEYMFTPTADDDITVRVQQPLETDWDDGWQTYTANSDGSYTVKLYDGRNIIEVKSGNSVSYHVLRAYGLDLSIKNTKTGAEIGDSVPIGSTLSITFNGISSPLAKLGAVYNPGFPAEIYVVYNHDGQELEGEHCQYELSTTNTLYVTCDETGTFNLTGGKIHGSIIGAAPTTHRNLTLGGSTGQQTSLGSDGNTSVSFDGYLCSLPDISINVVGEKDTAAEEALNYCHITYVKNSNPSISIGDDAITAAAGSETDDDLAQVLTSNRYATTNSYNALNYTVRPENATKIKMLLRYWTEKSSTPQVMTVTSGQTAVTKKIFRYDDITYAELILMPDASTKAYNKTYTLRISNTSYGYNSSDVNPYYGNLAYLSGLDIVILNGIDKISTLHGLLKADPITYTDANNEEQTLDFGYGFLGTELNYSTTVPYATSQIQIMPTALVEGDATPVITVNGESVESGAASQTIDLEEGDNQITVTDTTGSDVKTYTVNVIRDYGPRSVTFTGQSGMAVVAYDTDGAKYSQEDDGTMNLVAGDYTYYASCSGYYVKNGTFTVTNDGTNIVDIGSMTAVPAQSGSVDVTITDDDAVLRDVVVEVDNTPTDLAKQHYVDYNNGGYTALHAIIDALKSGTDTLEFTCEQGALIPDTTISADNQGENAGWVCEVNGVAVDAASTLVNNGDQVSFYYNPDYADMLHAAFDTTTKTVEAGDSVIFTLTGTAAANDGSASSAVSGAEIYVNGKDTGIKTNSSGKASVDAFATAGKYVVTAVKTNASGDNILTFTHCVVTATKTETDVAGSTTVTFRLIGDTQHSNGTEDHDKYVNWISTHTYTFDSDDVTVYDVFTRALDGAGLSCVGADNNYVRKITAPETEGGYDLSEFTNGTFSGWMYTVNGLHPDVGLKHCEVSDGDVIIWHYVDNYMTEANDDLTYIYPCRWLEADDTEPAYITANIDIYELPDTVTLADKDAIEAARAAYDKLSTTEKSYISEERLSRLVQAEADLAALPQEPVVDVGSMTDLNENEWYYSYVSSVLAEGIMYGTSTTTFDPNGNLTRGQFVTILGRYAGISDSNTESPATTRFSDVKTTFYYASHVAWAEENGITSGTSETTFGPDAKITRQDMATMIARFAATMEIELPDSADAARFADDGDIADYAKEAVYSMVEAEIICGTGNNNFSPKAYATRAQAAKIICLLMNYGK